MAPMPLGLPPELGPPRMRVLPARDNGREEGSRVKRRRHTPEQVTKKLREADRLVAEGQEIAEVAKALEFNRKRVQRIRREESLRASAPAPAPRRVDRPRRPKERSRCCQTAQSARSQAAP